jgi:signal transduction histidine kinase/GAF domain-containing protein
MSFVFSLHIAITLATLGLGFFVYRTNPRRVVNQFFLLLSSTLVVWLLWLALAFAFTDLQAIAYCVRAACAVGAFMPVVFDGFRLSIVAEHNAWKPVARSSRSWFAMATTVAMMCLTPFFLVRVNLPAHRELGAIAEPVYGPGILIYALYQVTLWVMLMRRFMADLRILRGVRRIELQFILLASGVGIFAAVMVTVILPMVLSSSQVVRLAPTAVILFVGIIAYGIATRKIMEVAHVLQVIAAYCLATAYLVGLYCFVWLSSGFLFVSLLGMGDMMAHLLAALAVAFSFAPAQGRIQRVANRLFINVPEADLSRTVQQATGIIHSIGTLDDLLKRFAGVIRETVDPDRVLVLLAEGDRMRQAFSSVDSSDVLELARDDAIVQAVAANHDVLVADLIDRLHPSATLDAAGRRFRELQFAVACSMRSKGRLEGILLLGPRLSGRVYGRHEQSAIRILADQLAVAVENAKLYTQLEGSKIYNDNLVDSLVSGVIAANEKQVITVCNREARRITGLCPNRMLGQPVTVLPAPLSDMFKQTYASGHGVRNRDLTLHHGGANPIPVQLGSSIFYDLEGNVLGALVVFTDMTTVRKLETQVRRTAHLASLGTLSAGMAHEIKNPLVTLKTFSQLLPERYEEADFRSTFSGLVEREVNRIDSIVNQLLQFGRPAEARLRPLSIRDALDHALQLVVAAMQRKGVALQTQWHEGRDMINGDIHLLEQAFVNFFLNAVESMDGGGVLTVSTVLVGNAAGGGADGEYPLREPCIGVNITDTGVGMNPEVAAKVFDPFFTTKAQGTGLGLSVAHGIIQEHKGLIDIDSVPGEGTTFRILFPLVG